MKKLLFITLALLGAYTSQAVTDTVKTDITTNTTWTANKKYVLDGFIYVKNNATLTIEPGTVIYGSKATKGTLIITRNGKINAAGTDTNPIVFTSMEAPGSRSYGDWGGVIILGKAPTNSVFTDGSTTTAGLGSVEGGVNNTALDGLYGDGANSDPFHNSGTFKYVRIEFPGIPFQPNNEINGLTLGGVGKGTEINHIQVSYSGDDSYEWFGGTVNASHLIALRGWDDDFDCDNGYNGNVQFGIVVRDPNIADASGSNCFEQDNDAAGDSVVPITAPTFSNITVIGPKVNSSTIATDYQRGMHLRRNTRTSVFNSILVGWNKGIYIDGAACEGNVATGDLVIRNTYIADMSQNFVSNTSLNVGNWFKTSGYGNDSSKTLSDFKFNNTSLTSPDVTVQTGSAALNKAAWTHARLSNSFFDNSVTYIGARGNSGTDGWNDNGWINWDPQNTVYEAPASTNDFIALSRNVVIFPNPAKDVATLNFDLMSNKVVAYTITDLTGKVILSENETALAGNNQKQFNVANLSNGFYLLQLHIDGKLDRTLKFNISN